MNANDTSRFFAKVDKFAPLGCWLWTARKNNDGYGMFRIGHRSNTMQLAHRVAYEHHFGGFDKRLCVLHRCDNPACVNPEHLFVGTQADNVRDMLNKGRHVALGHPGESHPLRKLSAAQVVEIRRRYIPKVVTLKTLSEEYGISQSSISMIVNGHAWKCVSR